MREVFNYPSAVNWGAFDQSEVPGWDTTHPTQTNGCPATAGSGLAAYTCNPIELWFNNFNGVQPVSGIVLAELNAYAPSKLYQNVCILNGESFGFSFAHRGRSGIDSARLEMTSTPILTVQSGNTTGVSGAPTVISPGASGVAAASIANGWTRYTGNFTNPGASGIRQLGFVAVSTSGGNLSVGNFLDDVSISFKPYAELTTSTVSVEGSAMAQIPRLQFVGQLASPMGMTLTFNAPVANYGTDFNFGAATSLTGVTVAYNALTRSGTLSFAIPAGTYIASSGNTLIPIPLNIIDNTTIQDNRVINIQMPFIGTLGYTVTFANVTPAILTIAPLAAHDVIGVNLADAVPAGATFSSWTCAAQGGAVCPAASGSGAIAGTTSFPAGATLTYIVPAVSSSATASCNSTILNTSTIAINASSAQPTSASFPTGTVSLGTYTLTVTNGGPSAANGATVLDQPSAGLSCTAASCSVASGAAAAHAVSRAP